LVIIVIEKERGHHSPLLPKKRTGYYYPTLFNPIGSIPMSAAIFAIEFPALIV